MRVYFATINDKAGNAVLTTKYAATSKEAAAIAVEFIEKCPPAMGFTVKCRFLDAKEIARMLNEGT